MGRLNTFNQFLQRCFPERVSALEKMRLMGDVFSERILHGTELQDYFQYEFYNLKSRERRKYMTFSKLRKTIRICNDPEKRSIFDDKALFNQTFSKYIRRDWLNMQEASIEEFRSFLEKHKTFFAKARKGMFGEKAGLACAPKPLTDDAVRELYQRYRTEDYLIEQPIEQHPAMAAFNGSSVNTLRIVTLRLADGSPKIMAGVLRIGRAGESADNFHHDGIAATIDVDTGIVDSAGIDRNFKRYIIHPDSGRRIIGFEIPLWDKATRMVLDAAMAVPEVRYVGWDVAMDSEGEVQLIEGNYGADPDVTQMPCRTGKWPLFSEEVEKIARKG